MDAPAATSSGGAKQINRGGKPPHKGERMNRKKQIIEVDSRALNRRIDALWRDPAKMARLARDVFGVKKIDERA